MYCQVDFPEWEKIDYDSFSSISEVKIVSNHKSELFGILPTGVFKSTNQGDNWNRLNMPDSIIYDQIFINKNIIAAYGFSYSDYKQIEGYLVYLKIMEIVGKLILSFMVLKRIRYINIGINQF